MNNFVDHALESRPALRTLIPHELRFYSRPSWWPSAATDGHRQRARIRASNHESSNSPSKPPSSPRGWLG